MKITRLPSTRPINQPPKIVVVQEKKSGCLPFIIGIVLVLLAIILLYVILVIGGCHAALMHMTENDRAKSSPSSALSAKAATSDAPAASIDIYSFSESKDAMTDATRYIFSWKSEKSRERFSLTHEALVLRFSPTEVSRSTHKMKYDIDCYFVADFAFVDDKPANVSVRFDNKAAQSWKCTPSSDRSGYFVEDARGFLSEIAYARRARVRFAEFGGNQRDLDFNLGFFSLQNFREKIVECVLRSNPPNVKITD